MRLNVPCREVAASVFDFLAGDQSKCSTRLSNSAQLLGSESPVDSQMAIRPKRQQNSAANLDSVFLYKKNVGFKH